MMLTPGDPKALALSGPLPFLPNQEWEKMPSSHYKYFKDLGIHGNICETERTVSCNSTEFRNPETGLGKNDPGIWHDANGTFVTDYMVDFCFFLTSKFLLLKKLLQKNNVQNKTHFPGAGEVARSLRTLIVLAEDLSSVSSTHMRQLTGWHVSPVLGYPMLSVLHWCPHTHCVPMQALTFKKSIYFFSHFY